MANEENIRYFKVNADVGYLLSADDATKYIKQYEERTTSKFVCTKQNKVYGKEIDPFHLNGRIFWEDMRYEKSNRFCLTFDGSPFMVAGKKLLECHHGADRNMSAKAKYKAKKESEGMSTCKRQRVMTLGSKKFGCPAQIRIREILKFHRYKITKNNKTNRLKAARNLREDLQSNRNVTYERRFYIQLPKESDHKQHATGEEGALFQRIDKQIIQFIHRQVCGGERSVARVQQQVRDFVINHLFSGKVPPPPTIRRYHPSDQDIRNHIYMAQIKSKMISGEHHHCISPSCQKSLTTTDSISLPPMPLNHQDLNELVGDSIRLDDDQRNLSLRMDYGEIVNESDVNVIQNEDNLSSPLTIHLQVNPEETEAMADECQKLLKSLLKETRTLTDPNVLHRLRTALHHVKSIIEEKDSLVDDGSDEENELDVPSFCEERTNLKEPFHLSNDFSQQQLSTAEITNFSMCPFTESDYMVFCETQSASAGNSPLQIMNKGIVSDS